MRQADAALNAALKSGERAAAHSVRLGGRELGAQVASWSLDRSYATDLPDAMRAFSGSSSAQLEVDVTGAGGASAPALYGPWAPRSTGDVTRPGQSATHRWGLNGSTLGTFRGAVRSRSAASGTDVVRLSALDGAERLRMPARVPRPDGTLRFTGWSTPWVASPVWVVDHLLRAAGIHTCPPPRPGCVLYASLHGGVAADIGYLESVWGSWREWYKEGAPFECAAEGGFTDPYRATYVPEGLPSFDYGGTWYEFYAVNQKPYSLDSAVEIHTTWSISQGWNQNLTLSVNFTQGTMSAYCGRNDDPTKNAYINWKWPLLKTEGKRLHVGWWVRYRAPNQIAITPVVTVDNGAPAFLPDGWFDATVMRFASALDRVRFSLTNLRAECFQMSSLTAQPTTLAEVTQEGTWKRSASLSRPRFPLRMLPAIRGTAWDVITEIARATLATAEFTADGHFLWKDHTRWSDPPTSADVEVTSSRELAGLTITEEIDACRNYCTVRVSDWDAVRAGKAEILRDSVSPMPIGPGETLVRSIPIQETKTDPRTPKCLQTGGSTDVPDTVVIRDGADPDSALLQWSIDVTMRRDLGGITLSLRNRDDNRTIYYHGAQLTTLAPDGEPGHWMWSAWNEYSQRAYGTQAYEHDVKGWVQDLASAKALAETLRDAGAWPVPLMQSVEILPDPRIELGDVVRVRDSTGARLDTLAWVIGIKTSGTGGQVTQTLTLRGTANQGEPQDAGLTPDPPTDPNTPPPP
ncbi:hypothetical protein [Streptomyces olivoreticuli]|uniref:hypothetical protein n=1 Tax=Streptomyces olivoreticuli TaxID=68246 RepID=UPI0013C317AB|nr:hypothetical protein [Streptomyces olivoreticuli]